MHPIERLRYVARAGAAAGGEAVLADEAADALAALGDDHAGLVTACRRILDRHPASGVLWWLASRVLTSSEPVREARRVARDLEGDPTAAHVAAELPDEVTVCVIGWPEQVGEALGRRPDLRVFAVDVHDELAWRSARGFEHDEAPRIVAGAGLGWAASTADLLLLEASALGTHGLAGTAGSRAAAAVARHSGRTVWAVAGVGRVLAPRLWDALAARLDTLPEPWDSVHEVVPLDLVDVVVGSTGRLTPAEAVAGADCPVAPELLRAVPRLGADDG
ncbi:MAG: hypothetical protein ACRD29_05230 [Acidimicrobiales bacterium]